MEKKGGRKEKRGGRKEKRGGRKEERRGRKEKTTPVPPSYIEEEQTTQRKSTNGQTTYLCVRISILLLSTIFFRILELFRRCGIVCFYIISG